MPHGVIEDFSEVVQWKIPDFFLLNKVKNEYIDSPQFSSLGSTWHLTVYPKGDRVDGWLAVYLNSSETMTKATTFTFGFKRADGKMEEIHGRKNIFGKDRKYGWGVSKFFDLKHLQQRKSELVTSDALTVTCRIERDAPAPEEIRIQNHQEMDFLPTTFLELEDLSSDLQGLLNSEKICDFTVNVQGKEFRVHRSLLAARSSVFRAMLEHDTAEAKRGVLDIPDSHSESFQEFINFLYTGKIEEVTFELAYHLYSTAEKYDVQRLKSCCVNYLKQNLSADNVCKVVILSDQFCDEQLQSSAQDFFNKNFMQIFQTSEWEAMMRNHSRIFNKVLKEMASASSKNS